MIMGYWDRHKAYVDSGMTEDEAHEQIMKDEWHNENDIIEE